MNFDVSLLNEFINPALRWLFRSGPGSSPSAKVDAHAEVALTLLAITELINGGKRSDLDNTIIVSAIGHVEWLIEATEFHDDGSRCWDHSPWDTAVCARALFGWIMLESDELFSSQDMRDRAIASALSAIEWMTNRFQEYTDDPIFRWLSASELAQIGLSLVAKLKYLSYPNAEAEDISNTQEACEEVVHSLLISQSEDVGQYLDSDDSSVAPLWWESYFNTADVLQFLVDYLGWTSTRLSDDDSHGLYNRALDSVFRCTHFIEHSQRGPFWGAYAESANVLATYVRVGGELGQISRVNRPICADPSAIFRSIRWFCDPTQRMGDGSILHTPFLTTFYVYALAGAVCRWDVAKRPLLDVYDDLIRISIRSQSANESDLATARLELENLTERTAQAERSLLMARDNIHDLRWSRSRWISTFSTSLGIAVLMIIALVLFGGLRISMPRERLGGLVAAAGVFIALVVGVLAIIWNRHPSPSGLDDRSTRLN